MEPVRVVADDVREHGLSEALRRALLAAPRGACATVLIHGYKFRPGDARRDPHARLYGGPAPAGAARCGDWARALGAEGAGPVIGFGWDARAWHLSSLLAEGRNGFARVYDRAAEAGEALRALLEGVRALRPDLTVDLFAHSLGARVALAAARSPRVGRMILLGAAEDAERAAEALPARPGRPGGRRGERPGGAVGSVAAGGPGGSGGSGGPQVFHVAARHNDLFDAMFEAAAPRIGGRAPRALGRAGLGEPRGDWIDLQLDAPPLADWLARRGVALDPRSPAVCHWSFYARPGAMALYRRILRDRRAWSIQALRAAGAPEGLSPRWSRLAPRGGGRLAPALAEAALEAEGAAEAAA